MSSAEINGGTGTFVFFFNITTTKYQTLELSFKTPRAGSLEGFLIQECQSHVSNLGVKYSVSHHLAHKIHED